jgi:protein-S-isoprenylcysteine O-methyltransferase Ste14
MATLAVVLYAVLLAITFGIRVALQVRRTGSTGLAGLPSGAAPLEWVAGGFFISGGALGAVSPLLVLLGGVEPLATLDGPVGHLAGVILALAGIGLTFGAQLAMGDSWRIGVDADQRTELVTGGPFALVRNPIYSALLPTAFGLVLMVPTVPAILGLLSLFAGFELQVRLVEEPYLLRVHGNAYGDYAARVGRFVPGVGLMSSR